MLTDLLNERHLPDVLRFADGEPVTAERWEERRRELLTVLEGAEYGRFPERVGGTTWNITKTERITGGTAKRYTVDVTFPAPDGESFTFPAEISVPDTASAEHPVPAFVYISFSRADYTPMEELMDNGVAVAEFSMNAVAFDGEDHWTGLLARHFYPDGQRAPDASGKIGFWAYAASRLLDCLLSFSCVDASRIGVVGHSRLGKTALWAGANDTRFTHVFSNDSGCSGAAIERGKIGERFERIVSVFPYWFSESMKETAATPASDLPFDQHFLLAAVAPRKVYVASASEDEWADPTSEFLSCVAVSPVWEMLGKPGFHGPDSLPEPDSRYADGDVGYHLRRGTHYLSRRDWLRYIEYIKR